MQIATAFARAKFDAIGLASKTGLRNDALLVDPPMRGRNRSIASNVSSPLHFLVRDAPR
jgi:hypothetical protein